MLDSGGEVAAQNLAAVARAQGAPGGQANVVAHEPHGAVAQKQVDAARVAAFFQGFVTELSVVDPRQSSEPLSSPGRKVSLASLAAPGRGRAAEPPSSASPDKSIITTSQISKFYTDVAAGKYPKAEADRLEKMIFDAQSEGRIKQA